MSNAAWLVLFSRKPEGLSSFTYVTTVLFENEVEARGYIQQQMHALAKEYKFTTNMFGDDKDRFRAAWESKNVPTLISIWNFHTRFDVDLRRIPPQVSENKCPF